MKINLCAFVLLALTVNFTVSANAASTGVPLSCADLSGVWGGIAAPGQEGCGNEHWAIVQIGCREITISLVLNRAHPDDNNFALFSSLYVIGGQGQQVLRREQIELRETTDAVWDTDRLGIVATRAWSGWSVKDGLRRDIPAMRETNHFYREGDYLVREWGPYQCKYKKVPLSWHGPVRN
ncbi:MAG: hypothetical protein AB7G93_15915 [Bdellovibrionales bacterium]